MIVICRFAVLLFTLTGLSVQAGDFNNNSVSYETGWLYINQGGGLIANIPAHETYEVLSHAQNVRSELKAQKNKFVEEVENTRFKARDAFIAAVMPGGLLYTAHKKQRHHQAKEELKTVTAQLEGLEEDIDFLKIAFSKETLASL